MFSCLISAASYLIFYHNSYFASGMGAVSKTRAKIRLESSMTKIAHINVLGYHLFRNTLVGCVWFD
jgi:hypothetical protein